LALLRIRGEQGKRDLLGAIAATVKSCGILLGQLFIIIIFFGRRPATGFTWASTASSAKFAANKIAANNAE